MIGSADHPCGGQIDFQRDILGNGHRLGVTVGRRVRVDFLPNNLYPATHRDVIRRRTHEHQGPIARLEAGVAQIDLKHDIAWHAVDRVGEHFPFARGRHGVGAYGFMRGSLHGERQLGCGKRSITASGHEHSARMTALARDADAIRARAGDGLHNADGNMLLLEQRPLFDVQFDKRGVKVFRQDNRIERVLQPCASAKLIE